MATTLKVGDAVTLPTGPTLYGGWEVGDVGFIDEIDLAYNPKDNIVRILHIRTAHKFWEYSSKCHPLT